LIGGSIGLALRKRTLARHVVGIGRRLETLRIAENRGAITAATTDLAEGIADAQLAIICTPVETVVDYVEQIAKTAKPGMLITDAGSTKASIVAGADRVLASGLGAWTSFVGSHPLAGSERTGPEFARDDLFEGRTVVVTPSDASRGEAVEQIEQLWQALGARVVRMSPAEHDAAVAATSHVPHVVASAVAASTPHDHLSLVAGGWLDTTRVAAGDVQLWRQILSDNRQNVAEHLAKLQQVLSSFRQALEQNDEAELVRLLQQGKRTRDSVGS
jgi:prephenate dehydrogenase